MIGLSAEAARQVAELLAFYGRKNRSEAIGNLDVALRLASDRIERDPDAGLLAPRPYPELSHEGERWVKQGRYWLAYGLTTPPVILAVFYDQADIPGRL